MTFRAMAMASGMISLIATLLGVNIANRGRESVNSVSHVMKKWKAAKVSWASFNEGSEKIALFVKTFGNDLVSFRFLSNRRVHKTHDADCRQCVDNHPYHG